MTASLGSRRWGVLLVGLVLLAAAVVPNLSPREVAGAAQATFMPGPPAVGDCVGDPVDPGWDNLGPTTTGTASVTYSYPQVEMSHCQNSRYGDVTALIADPTTPVVTTLSDSSSGGTTVVDANMDICRSATSRYVGIALAGDQVAPLLAGWYPNLVTATAASAPSVRQQAAGQHWLASIVYLPQGSDQGSVADRERYDKSLRNALFTGEGRNRTGLCLAGADLAQGDSGLIGCGTDHHSELFGLGTTGDQPMVRTDLLRSCRQVVARLTDNADFATAGLTVQVLATDMDQTPITSAAIPAHTNLNCGVSTTNHRVLVGSLLSIGSQPIPSK